MKGYMPMWLSRESMNLHVSACVPSRRQIITIHIGVFSFEKRLTTVAESL